MPESDGDLQRLYRGDIPESQQGAADLSVRDYDGLHGGGGVAAEPVDSSGFVRGTLPSFFSLIYSMKNAIRADQELGARNRVRGYYAELMTEVAYAKELKAYGLYPVLIDRWDQESSFINRERLLLEKKNAVRRLVLLHMQKADVSDDQIIRALERVGLSGLLKELGYDLDIPLGKLFEDGRELSGGQWQRARALLGDSEYIFLDEPTSALDPISEIQVMEAFLETTVGRTAVVVSHRIGVARRCDKILVIDHQRAAEFGTHAELMEHQGPYRKMVELQASLYQ